MPYKVLILDSDESDRSALVGQFDAEFEVSTCELARQAIIRIEENRPDILLLDADPPDLDGLTFLRVVRTGEKGKDLPVILMSRHRTEGSVVDAFGAGVDDYLAKPVNPREAVVRVRAVLRRRYERLEHWGSALSIGGVEIDPSQRRCVVFGRLVRLQHREFELLEVLMRKAGRVLTRVYLLETVWGMSGEARTRAVDMMVSRLRKRLGPRGAKLLETVSKLGYCFREAGT